MCVFDRTEGRTNLNLKSTHRATTSAGKPVPILRAKAETNLAFPSSLVVCSCFFKVKNLTCLDRFMIFAPTHHECVIVFIKCSCPISLCFFLCLVLIF